MNAEFFRPPLDYPRIPYDQMLSHGADRHPENVAVVFRDVSLTYRELEALTNRFARALLALGVAKGDRVCVLAPNCPEYLIAFYAIARVGDAAGAGGDPGGRSGRAALLERDDGAPEGRDDQPQEPRHQQHPVRRVHSHARERPADAVPALLSHLRHDADGRGGPHGRDVRAD